MLKELLNSETSQTESEKNMTSLNKKRKCHNTLLDRGGEKGKLFKSKHYAMFHKKDRNHNKDVCKHIENE